MVGIFLTLGSKTPIALASKSHLTPGSEMLGEDLSDLVSPTTALVAHVEKVDANHLEVDVEQTLDIMANVCPIYALKHGDAYCHVTQS